MEENNVFHLVIYFMKKLLVFFGISLFFTTTFSVNAQQKKSSTPPTKKSECLIKSNISVSSGKKWYHLPGMKDYEKTQIHTNKGERWFCTEEEARKSGWQKAPTN
jgi:hypothetical protein